MSEETGIGRRSLMTAPFSQGWRCVSPAGPASKVQHKITCRCPTTGGTSDRRRPVLICLHVGRAACPCVDFLTPVIAKAMVSELRYSAVGLVSVKIQIRRKANREDEPLTPNYELDSVGLTSSSVQILLVKSKTRSTSPSPTSHVARRMTCRL